MKNPESRNSLMIEALYGRSEVYNISGNPEAALSDLKRSLVLAKKTKEKKWEAEIMMFMCISFEMLSMYQEMKVHAEHSAKIFKKLKDEVGYANAMNSVGMQLGIIGQYDKELKIMLELLGILRPIYNNGKSRKWEVLRAGATLSYVLNNIGYIYRIKKDNDKAIENYLESLKIRRKIIDKAGEALSLNNIGMIYGRLREIDKSFSYFNEALKILELIGEKKMYASVIHNMAHLYALQNNKEKSLECFYKALEIQRQIKDRFSESFTLGNLGNFYMKEKKYSKALVYLGQAVIIRKEIDINDGMVKLYMNTGTVYEMMENLNKANEFFNKAYEMAKMQENKEEMDIALESMEKISGRGTREPV